MSDSLKTDSKLMPFVHLLFFLEASKVFMLDAVIDEDRDKLTKDMEENPGIAITIGNKLTEILGLTNTANLKKL